MLFAEFGLPTYRAGDPAARRRREPWLVEEQAAAAYTGRALDGAAATAGAPGALLWCYADYAPAIWTEPAARRGRPRAFVRAVASRRVTQAVRCRSWRPSPGLHES